MDLEEDSKSIVINDIPDVAIEDMIVDSLYVDAELIKMKSMRDFNEFVRILPSWTNNHDNFKYADLR